MVLDLKMKMKENYFLTGVYIIIYNLNSYLAPAVFSNGLRAWTLSQMSMEIYTDMVLNRRKLRIILFI